MEFVDPAHGWALVRLNGDTADDQRFVTNDAGEGWRK